MPKFKIIYTQQVLLTRSVIIEADNYQEAEQELLNDGFTLEIEEKSEIISKQLENLEIINIFQLK